MDSFQERKHKNFQVESDPFFDAIFHLFKKAKACLRINFIEFQKKIVQFCYLHVRLYLGIETVSCRLLQRMATTDKD